MKRTGIYCKILLLSLFTFLVEDTLADCFWLPLKIDTLNNESYVVKILNLPDSSIISKDTISPDRFLASLLSKYNSKLKCYIGQIDSVIRYTQWQDPWWVYMDSVKVISDTVIKGNIPFEFWLTDGPDPWRMCRMETMDSCIGIADDSYKPYSRIQDIRYLFFSDSVSLRGSSVNPDWCRGDEGNIIDDSNFIWSDYRNGYPKVRVPLQNFLSAIQVSSVHPFIKEQKALNSHNDRISSKLYDIRGRKIDNGRMSNTVVCVRIATNPSKSILVLNLSRLERK